MESFGRRLRAAMDARGPLCVGVDPHPGLLAAWGLDDDAAGLDVFATTCVEALAADLAVLKPQSAFFERHGSAGIAVLERLVVGARERGALVILDAKRGDIGSTMQGYADAYLDRRSPLAVDAITVNPFLGFESLRPILDSAAAEGAGLFVLALTSNPEGSQVQRAKTPGGTVSGDILTAIAAENADQSVLGSVGAVVAANLAILDEDLEINGPLLAPGFGAQGGTVDDVRRIFGRVRHLVLPSTSRAVLRAGPDVAALRASALRTVETVSAIVDS
ncbi:MAG: orotidine-5'-phosphate decarboxylase [Propionibacteriales bacterium]|nr:orotidine-5'-phosphate decarboxylase [Propionibacteriales bacterium]